MKKAGIAVITGIATGLGFLLFRKPAVTQACIVDSDCPSGYRCSNGVCVPVTPPTPQCTRDSDCPSGYRCSNGVCVPVTPTTYSLTVSVSGYGSTNPVPGQYTKAAGTTVTLIATPASGYVFTHWTLNGEVVNTSTVPVVMNGNITAIAYFEQAAIPPPTTRRLTVSVYGGYGGTTHPLPEQFYDLPYGTSVNLQAIAASGYIFTDWEITVLGYVYVSSDPVVTVVLENDITAVARFEEADTLPGLPYPDVEYRRPTTSEVTYALGKPGQYDYWQYYATLKLCQNWASQQPYPVSDWYQRWSMMGYCYGGGGWTWAVGAQPNRTGEWFWEGMYAFFPTNCLIEWAKFKAYLVKNPQPPESGYDAYTTKIEGWMQ